MQMFKFGCELLFSSLHTYKCRPYFGIYLHSLVLSFLFVEVVYMVEFVLSHSKYARDSVLLEKKLF